MLRLDLGTNTEKLRTDFLRWIRSHKPPVIDQEKGLDNFVEQSRVWQNTLAKDNWLGLSWPEEFGGRGLSLIEETIIQECLAEYNSPQLVGLFGITMVGPVLIKHGTQDQKQRFLKKILLAENIWCQGFSEPQAGSDLASLKTVAKKVQNTWELSGQKVWTSFAQFADWCFVLARTNSEVPQHQGLSYFLLPMEAKGIEIRPLKQITGEEEFNELFLENTPTDSTNLVGQEGEGWQIAISTLMYERVILTFARHLQSERLLSDIKTYLQSLLKNNTLQNTLQSKDPKNEQGKKEPEIYKLPQAIINNSTYLQNKLAFLIARNMSVRALALNHLSRYTSSYPGPEGSMDKLAWSEHFQDIAKFALELSETFEDFSSPFAKNFAHQYLYSRGRTIAAGTSEIQRNIIAQRVLGLR